MSRARPRHRPSTLAPLVMGAAILAVAAALALFGRGGAQTPHGRLVAALGDVAEAQEAYFRETGRFAGWSDSLEVRTGAGIELTQLQGGPRRWHAVVRAPAAQLACTRSGRRGPRRPIREETTCFRLGE